jgi:hypothetical protein
LVIRPDLCLVIATIHPREILKPREQERGRESVEKEERIGDLERLITPTPQEFCNCCIKASFYLLSMI